MPESKVHCFRKAELPWSEGLLSARLWKSGERTVVGVPELGLHCYGSNEAEAVFRLFALLLKYYRQLKTHKSKLGSAGLAHLDLLSAWVASVENRMRDRSSANVIVPMKRRASFNKL